MCLNELHLEGSWGRPEPESVEGFKQLSTLLRWSGAGGMKANIKKRMSDSKDDQQHSKEELDNRSAQLNSNNDAYWDSRGYDGRPDDWQSRDE